MDSLVTLRWKKISNLEVCLGRGCVVVDCGVH